MRVFVPTLLWPTMVATFSVAGMRFCSLHYLQAHKLELTQMVLHAVAILVCLVLLTIAQLELAIRSIAVTRVALGSEDSIKVSLTYAKRRKYAAMLLYNLAVFLPALVLILWTVLTAVYVLVYGHGKSTQILSFLVFSFVGLGATTTTCWALLGSSMAFTVLSFEDVKLGVVCSRAWKLSYDYFWRGGSYMVLLGATLFAVGTAINLPFLTVSLADAFQSHALTSASYNEPLYLQVISAVSDGLINIVLLGVAPIAMGFYYNDLCLRAEGRDITSRLDKLRAPSLS